MRRLHVVAVDQVSLNAPHIIVQSKTTPTGTHYRSIQLNQPARRNCLDLTTIDALIDTVRESDGSPLLLASAPPAFCAGLDLKEILKTGSPEKHLRKLVTLLVEFANHPKATICYVKGPTRAGGVALACCADHVIAHTNATFMIPGESVYKPMASILTPILAATQNLSLEKLDVLPGCLLGAESAKSLGLIDEVHEDQEDVTTAIDRAFQKAPSSDPQPNPITPAVLQEVNARFERATILRATAPLIQHLRERFGKQNQATKQ